MSALKRVLLSVPGGAGVDGGVLLPRVMMAAFVMNANRALMGPCLRAFALCHCDGFFTARRLQCLATSYSSNA